MTMQQPQQRNGIRRRQRIATLLLRLYPAAWRARYGEEMLAVLLAAGATWRGIRVSPESAGVPGVAAR